MCENLCSWILIPTLIYHFNKKIVKIELMRLWLKKYIKIIIVKVKHKVRAKVKAGTVIISILI